MTCEEYLSNMKPGYIVDGGSEEHLVMHELSQRALKITMELNNKYHTKEEIIQLMSELTGQKIDESFGMFPPFYTDCGRNIHIGKNVFINAGCKFQDQGGIYIENGVLEGSVIAAGAVATKDVPANMIAAGVPAKIIRKVKKDTEKGEI